MFHVRLFGNKIRQMKDDVKLVYYFFKEYGDYLSLVYFELKSLIFRGRRQPTKLVALFKVVYHQTPF